MSSDDATASVDAPAATREVVIRAEGVGKNFRIYDKPHHRLLQGLLRGRRYGRDFWALRDVDLSVRRGETVGIVGRNGSGKSTLLQILCGTLSPTAGRVSIGGRIAALLELGAGFNPEFTGRENAFLNASILGLAHAEIERRFDAIAAFAEIGDFMDQPVKTYSSGMFVRLAFAVAINVDPAILVVDEALAVGDARFQAKCLNAIKKMKERGVTILFVSHDVGSVRSLCDRAIWLDQGLVRMEGDAFPVTAHYTQYLFDSDDVPGATPEAPAIAPRQTAAPDELVVEAAAPAPAGVAPINHWGTHVGCILEAGVFDMAGERRDVFVGRERLRVRIRFRVPERADRDTLSVAFSIKNLRGTDLIVSTTWDEKRVAFDAERGEFEVSFEFENCLNTGKYLLVAALEDRAGAVIQYYEYVEGAQYFSTLFETEYCGIFLPHVTQRLDEATPVSSESRNSPACRP